MTRKDVVDLLAGYIHRLGVEVKEASLQTSTAPILTLQKMVIQGDKFDKSMVFLMRNMIKNFLEIHGDV